MLKRIYQVIFLVLLLCFTVQVQGQQNGTVVGKPIFENVTIFPDYCFDFMDKQAGVGGNVWGYNIQTKQVHYFTSGIANALVGLEGDLSYKYNGEFSIIEPFFPNDATWLWVFRLTDKTGKYTHWISLYWSDTQQRYYARIFHHGKGFASQEPTCGDWELSELPPVLQFLVDNF